MNHSFFDHSIGHYTVVPEHQGTAENQGCQIPLVLNFVFRRATVRGFDDSVFKLDIGISA